MFWKGPDNGKNIRENPRKTDYKLRIFVKGENALDGDFFEKNWEKEIFKLFRLSNEWMQAVRESRKIFVKIQWHFLCDGMFSERSEVNLHGKKDVINGFLSCLFCVLFFVCLVFELNRLFILQAFNLVFLDRNSKFWVIDLNLFQCCWVRLVVKNL